MAMVNRDSVFEAADALVESGMRPTLQNVRDKLGGGSFSTLSKFMEEYRAQAAAKSHPIKEPAPEAISEQLGAVAAEIWATALSLANARLSAEREGLEQARAELEQSQAEAIELADQLSDENEQLKSSLFEREHLIKTLTAQVSELTSNAQKDAAQYTELKAEADKAQVKIGEIEKRVSDYKERLEQQKTELTGTIEKISEQSDRLVKEKDAKLTAVQEQLITTQAKIEQLLQDRNNLASELSTLRQVLDERTAANATLVSEKDAAMTRANELSKELKATNAELKASQKEAATLTGQLSALSKQK